MILRQNIFIYFLQNTVCALAECSIFTSTCQTHRRLETIFRLIEKYLEYQHNLDTQCKSCMSNLASLCISSDTPKRGTGVSGDLPAAPTRLQHHLFQRGKSTVRPSLQPHVSPSHAPSLNNPN